MSLNLILFAPKHVLREHRNALKYIDLFQTPSKVSRAALSGNTRDVYFDFLKTSVQLEPKDLAEHMKQVDAYLNQGYTWGLQ